MNTVFVVGSLNADLVLRAERLPAVGETLTASDLAVFPGGKGANQAFAAARLGAPVRMAGKVGPDDYGTQLCEGLASAGVDCVSVQVSARPTGIAVITILPSGDNTILLSPGANHDIEPAWVESWLSAMTAGSVLLCQLEIPLPATLAALRAARHHGAWSILDPAPARVLTREELALPAILTPNQTEIAMLLGGAPVPIHYEDGVAACRKLRELGARHVVLKLGSLGCVLVQDEGVHIAPGFSVHSVDTTAAGDTFNAALSVRLAAGQPLAEALEFANAAAAISVTRPGAQASAPTLAEVQDFLLQTRSPVPESVS